MDEEDVTRGSGVVNPTSYKNDVLTQAWIDSRTLATLMVWLDGLGSQPRTMSEIVRDPLKVLVRFLVDNGDVKMVDDTIVARQMLEKRTGVILNRGDKGRKNILHNIVLDERRSGLGDHIKSNTPDINTPRFDEPIHQGPDGFDMEKALKIFEDGDE